MKHDNDKPGMLNKNMARTILLFLLVVPLKLHAGAFRPPASKGKAEKTHIDPSLRTMEGTLVFDEKTKEALERAGTPGILLAESQEPNKIYRIRIVGAHKVEPDAVILRMRSKIGEAYNPVLIAEDIDEIWKMGLFFNVEVWQKALPTGAVELEYRLSELPTIFDIKVKGNSAFSDEEIKEHLSGLENYQVAKPDRLKANVEKIREFYISKGYFLADVSYTLDKTTPEEIKKREAETISERAGATPIEIDTANVAAPDFVDVVFHIKENAKVRVNRIQFMGNPHVSDDVLKESIRTHEEHALSILTDWGTFRKDFLEIDALLIEKVLNDRGFLKAKVLPPELELSPDKSFISITYRMIEGEQYFLGDLSVEGDLVEHNEEIYKLRKEAYPDKPIFYSQKLLELIKQRPGEEFNKSAMAENIAAIAEKYKDRGYAYVNISPIPTFDEESKRVNITIQIESGPQVTIERIDIEGNEKTKDKVIRRELSIFEGELYSAMLMRLSEEHLVRLGYFETVDFTTEPGSAPNKMIVKIKVKEQSTGNIQAGAGYGTGGEGLSLRLQLSNHNFLGNGQTVSASVNWSSHRKIFDLMFVEPYLTYIFDQPLTFAFTAYNRNAFLGEFSRSATGGDITLGYPIGGPFVGRSRKWKSGVSPSVAPYVLDFEALWFYLTYTAERVEITDSTVEVRNFNLHKGQPRYTTSLKPTIKLDQRDNRLAATRGIYAEFRTEFASEWLGGIGLAHLENKIRQKSAAPTLSDGRNYLKPPAEANNFIRYGTNLRLYHNLDDWFPLKGFVFKTNFELGFLNTLGKPLFFENYALGGPNTVRGYHHRSISPFASAGALFPFDSRREIAVGGNKQFYGSFELEFPLIKILKIGGVLFFDFGNVFGQEDNLFYIGGKSANAARIKPSDPLRLYDWLGLYSSVGFGVRWNSPLGYLRFEWGIPLNRRPVQTPGLLEPDRPLVFEFYYGPNF